MRTSLLQVVLVGECKVVKVLAETFRLVLTKDFVPNPASWPSLIPDLRQGLQSRCAGRARGGIVCCIFDCRKHSVLSLLLLFRFLEGRALLMHFDEKGLLPHGTLSEAANNWLGRSELRPHLCC